MRQHPDPSWVPLGRTKTVRWFGLPGEGRILLAWPDEDAVEDRESALENRAFIEAAFSERRGGVVCFLDRVGGLDRGGREVHFGHYGEIIVGVAYVGGTPLSRAIIGFALGLRPLQSPLKIVGSLAEGLAWLGERFEEAA